MPTPARMEQLSRHLGDERFDQLFPFRTMTGATRVIFGSGWPARPLNPLDALHVAVTQTTPEGTPEGGWHADERLELKPAIDAFTSTAAWASFDEQRKGSITAGMLADLIVLSDDIFAMPAGTLASTSVRVTVFDGKVVFQRTPRSETEPAPAQAPAPSLQH
jgi:predicted amidohydrolase YtcJ